MDSGAPARDAAVDSVDHTNCCVVGGGPAGVVLALLLARRGVKTILLEAHRDFDRDFRGDTLFPSVMEIMAQLGLADRLLELPHGKMRTMTFHTPAGARSRSATWAGCARSFRTSRCCLSRSSCEPSPKRQTGCRHSGA